MGTLPGIGVAQQTARTLSAAETPWANSAAAH